MKWMNRIIQMKMERILVKIFLVLTLIGYLWTSRDWQIVANEEKKRVYDEADLLTDEEEKVLNEYSLSLQDFVETEFYILTIEDAQGKTSVEYADDFGDENGFGYDKPYGNYIVFLIDMDNRDIWLSTSGKAEKYLTEARIDSVIDVAYEEVKAGRYYESCKAYLDTASTYMKTEPSNSDSERNPNSYPDTEYVYDPDTDGYKNYQKEMGIKQLILICLFISISIGAIVTALLCYQSRAKMTSKGATYQHTGGPDIRRCTDQYIRTVTRKRKIETQTSSSGGNHASSGGHHTSSGGHSHGGGGRRF